MLAGVSPNDVYVDTNVFVNALIAGMDQSEICFEAYEYLVVSDCNVYISHLTRLEFLEAIRALAHKQSLPDSFREEFALSDWESFMVRQRWLQFWVAKFDELLNTFYRVYELPYRQRIWHQAPQVMALYTLRAYDAFHVATATSYGIPELWTTDADLSRNPGGIYVRLLR